MIICPISGLTGISLHEPYQYLLPKKSTPPSLSLHGQLLFFQALEYFLYEVKR
jgi:hypothetical protein